MDVGLQRLMAGDGVLSDVEGLRELVVKAGKVWVIRNGVVS